MNLLYIFFISMIMQSLFSMDNSVSCTKINKIEHIMPEVTQPCGIGFVRENVIAVYEKSAFTVCNINKKSIIIQRKTENTIHDFAISKQGEKIALYEDTFLTMYNAVTGEQEWQKNIGNVCLKIAFNPQDCTQLISYDSYSDKLTIHFENLRKEENLYETLLYSNGFAHHSNKTEIIYSCFPIGFYVYNYENKEHFFSSVKELQLFAANDNAVGQYYTVDGSCIVLVAQNRINTTIAFIPSVVKSSKAKCIRLSKFYSSMLFHPNNNILFLLDPKNIIECWNYKKQKCIHIIKFENQEDIPLESYLKKRLAVSDDGNILFIALKDKCVKLTIPFEVFCSLTEKENLFFIMSVLKRYNDNGLILINDVIYAIIEKLVMLCKTLPKD